MANSVAKPPLVSVRGLCKDYAVRVLDGIDLDLVAGKVHALLGANGAGKSTLCRILAGLTFASSGEMKLAGEQFRPTDKGEAEDRGVQIVQQELNLLPSLTVAENLFLNHLPHRFGWIDYAKLHTDAKSALQRVGLQAVDPRTRTGALGVGSRQLVEIAAALVRDCRLLILDEPTAALTPVEIERLFECVRELAEADVAILYVSHRLEEIEMLCDGFTVLRDGCKVGSRRKGESSRDEMVSLMAGEATTESKPFQSYRQNQLALRVTDLCLGKRVRNISLQVHCGERLGIAGLVGSGRTELLRAIFGADQAESGTIRLGGAASDPQGRNEYFSHPREAVRRGIALLTEDRKTDGLLLPQPVRINASLATLPHTLGWIDRNSEISHVEARCRSLDTRFNSLEQPAEELSGGNQQKVVLAKWLESDADVYLLDEPTRGIDVTARQQIELLFADLARRGKALVIVSSDLDELMQLCDSIVALAEGRVVGRFERESWSRQRLMEAAFGDASRTTPGVAPA
jgi:ribose transport system ATP-binding protein|tara:strand:- start:6614 stop:8161 length:1548 start_codon:yes stop_codon:yes gene_type:complete